MRKKQTFKKKDKLPPDISLDYDDRQYEIDFDSVYVVRCECGAEVTYGKDSKFHSDWCPKAELE